MLSKFSFYGLILYLLILVMGSYLIINSHSSFLFILTKLSKYTKHWIPTSKLESVVFSLVSQHNGLILILGGLLIIYFIIGLIYLNLTFILNQISFLKLNLNQKDNINNGLQICLNYLLITIFMISFLLYYYYELPLTFADKAAFRYDMLFNVEPLICTKLKNYAIDYYVLILLTIGKLQLTIFRIYFVVNSLNLKPVINSDEIHYNHWDWIKIVMIWFSMIIYSQVVVNYILIQLMVYPLNKSYLYSLHDLINLINVSHYYLFISILIIIITKWLIKGLIYLKSKPQVWTTIQPGLIRRWFNLDLIIGYLKITQALGYYVLFSSGLILITHHIPSIYIVLGYKP